MTSYPSLLKRRGDLGWMWHFSPPIVWLLADYSLILLFVSRPVVGPFQASVYSFIGSSVRASMQHVRSSHFNQACFSSSCLFFCVFYVCNRLPCVEVSCLSRLFNEPPRTYEAYLFTEKVPSLLVDWMQSIPPRYSCQG